jgi:hypothetical protein
MGISTTQAIWRSGGDDSTRTAYCGSMFMAATFYTGNVAVASNATVAIDQNYPVVFLSVAGNVTVALNQNYPVILPANAVVTSVMITDPSTAGSINVGYVLVDGSASNTSYLVQTATATSPITITPGSTGNGAGLGTVMSATKEAVITLESSNGASGNVGGTIQYYVADYLFGQQNV